MYSLLANDKISLVKPELDLREILVQLPSYRCVLKCGVHKSFSHKISSAYNLLIEKEIGSLT